MKQKALLLAGALIVATGPVMFAYDRPEANVIYGMYSGTPLLMDAYMPAEPNGYGLLHIHGRGWHSSLRYGASELKKPRDNLLELLTMPDFSSSRLRRVLDKWLGFGRNTIAARGFFYRLDMRIDVG